MAHACPAPDCESQVEDRLLFCFRHWRAISSRTREVIAREWRSDQAPHVPGGEDPSQLWEVAVRYALDQLRVKFADPPAPDPPAG